MAEILWRPGYGGYCCYLGVDPSRRRQGIGTRLMRLLPHVLRVDAECAAEALPFVVWESRAPVATVASRAPWEARLRLFEKLGACWIAGMTFWAPSFNPGSEQSVSLQLFLLPVDQRADAFDAHKLRAVAAGLFRGVYRRQEGDPLFEKTLASARRPALRPVSAIDHFTPDAGRC